MNKKTIIIASTLLLTLIIMLMAEPASAIRWSIHEKRLIVYPFFDGLPYITQTKDGRIWVLWQRESLVENYSIVYTTSSDYGLTWKNETALTTDGINTRPSMIQAKNGTLWLVWSSDRPIPQPPQLPEFGLLAVPEELTIQQGDYNTSDIIVTSLGGFNAPVDLSVSDPPLNVTATLDPTQVIPPPNGSNDSTLTVTVGMEATPGNYTLTVNGTSDGLYDFVGITLEITQSPPLGSYTLKTGASLISSSSTSGNYELYYKTSNDNGLNWTKDTRLTFSSNDDLSPSIFQAKNGTIWLLWSSYRTGNYEIYYKTYNGTAWSDDTQLTNTTWHDKLPSITQTKNERIWVAWCSMQTGNYEIYYTTYDAYSWSSPTRLTFTTDIDMSPSIYQTIDGTIYVFYSSCPPTQSGTDDIYYLYSSNNGVSWSSPIQFTTNADEDSWPSITQISDTTIWVVWTSNRGDQPDGNFDIYYRVSLVGDINEDGIVDITDLATVAWSFATKPGDPNWNPKADINCDNRIDVVDLTLVARNYLAT